ncbi:MAG TPA: peroxiredoxin [Verrucomicrobiae bacterium]|nr:peroxiredoxin [Verrucomicrobiae bacterium]
MKAMILFLGAGLLVQSTVFGGEMPKVGDKAPDFSVAASDGTTAHLKDYVGKGNIVLYFYPKDDTKGCTAEACGIRDTMDEFKGLNATVLGVSFDSVESHKAFIAKYNLPFVLLADTDKKVAKSYGVADDNSKVASRVTFVIDKAGKIAFVDPKVNPATHAAELRTELAKLK